MKIKIHSAEYDYHNCTPGEYKQKLMWEFIRNYTILLEKYNFKDGEIEISSIEELFKLSDDVGHQIVTEGEGQILIYDGYIE